MDASEANEQLEMVDRILSHAVGMPRSSGALFISSWSPARVAAIAYTIFCVRRCRGRGRLSVVDAAFVRVFYVALLAAVVACYGAFNIFTGWGAGAIWPVGGAMLLASVMIANFTPRAVGYGFAFELPRD